MDQGGVPQENVALLGVEGLPLEAGLGAGIGEVGVEVLDLGVVLAVEDQAAAAPIELGQAMGAGIIEHGPVVGGDVLERHPAADQVRQVLGLDVGKVLVHPLLAAVLEEQTLHRHRRLVEDQLKVAHDGGMEHHPPRRLRDVLEVHHPEVVVGELGTRRDFGEGLNALVLDQNLDLRPLFPGPFVRREQLVDQGQLDRTRQGDVALVAPAHQLGDVVRRHRLCRHPAVGLLGKAVAVDPGQGRGIKIERHRENLLRTGIPAL